MLLFKCALEAGVLALGGVESNEGRVAIAATCMGVEVVG